MTPAETTEQQIIRDELAELRKAVNRLGRQNTELRRKNTQLRGEAQLREDALIQLKSLLRPAADALDALGLIPHEEEL